MGGLSHVPPCNKHDERIYASAMSSIHRNRNLLVIAGFLWIGLIGIIDYLTGYEIAFSVFYILPITFITWRTGQRTGLIATVISTLIWFVADISSGHIYSHTSIPFWNLLIRLAYFVIIMLLVSNLRDSLQREQDMSRTDFLTGAVNTRHFYEIAELEIARSQSHRQPLTLVYVDIDNFKAINDQFGHERGDQILRAFVSSIRKGLRKNDTIARLGGDEFALLLPETGQKSAQMLLSKIGDTLVHDMNKAKWSITLSIGVLTCTTPPHSIDEFVKMADNLMYSAKFGGKDAISYSTFED